MHRINYPSRMLRALFALFLLLNSISAFSIIPRPSFNDQLEAELNIYRGRNEPWPEEPLKMWLDREFHSLPTVSHPRDGYFVSDKLLFLVRLLQFRTLDRSQYPILLTWLEGQLNLLAQAQLPPHYKPEVHLLTTVASRVYIELFGYTEWYAERISNLDLSYRSSYLAALGATPHGRQRWIHSLEQVFSKHEGRPEWFRFAHLTREDCLHVAIVASKNGSWSLVIPAVEYYLSVESNLHHSQWFLKKIISIVQEADTEEGTTEALSVLQSRLTRTKQFIAKEEQKQKIQATAIEALSILQSRLTRTKQFIAKEEQKQKIQATPKEELLKALESQDLQSDALEHYISTLVEHARLAPKFRKKLLDIALRRDWRRHLQLSGRQRQLLTRVNLILERLYEHPHPETKNHKLHIKIRVEELPSGYREQQRRLRIIEEDEEAAEALEAWRAKRCSNLMAP